MEVVSSLISMKNDRQGHHEAPPTPSICRLATTPSTSQDINMEVVLSLIFMKNDKQRHNEAPPTPSICRPATTPSTNQDIYTKTESTPILTINNTQMNTSVSVESQLNNPPEEPPSEDILTTLTPATMPLKNPNTETESSPDSRIDSFFWGFYFLSLFFFFSFFWGIPTKIFIVVLSAWSSVSRREWKKRERGENTRTATSSRNPNPDSQSSPDSRIDSCFWGFYLLSVFSFFYFFWGNVTRMSIIALFVALCYEQKRRNKREKPPVSVNN